LTLCLFLFAPLEDFFSSGGLLVDPSGGPLRAPASWGNGGLTFPFPGLFLFFLYPPPLFFSSHKPGFVLSCSPQSWSPLWCRFFSFLSQPDAPPSPPSTPGLSGGPSGSWRPLSSRRLILFFWSFLISPEPFCFFSFDPVQTCPPPFLIVFVPIVADFSFMTSPPPPPPSRSSLEHKPQPPPWFVGLLCTTPQFACFSRAPSPCFSFSLSPRPCSCFLTEAIFQQSVPFLPGPAFVFYTGPPLLLGSVEPCRDNCPLPCPPVFFFPNPSCCSSSPSLHSTETGLRGKSFFPFFFVLPRAVSSPRAFFRGFPCERSLPFECVPSSSHQSFSPERTYNVSGFPASSVFPTSIFSTRF